MHNSPNNLRVYGIINKTYVQKFPHNFCIYIFTLKIGVKLVSHNFRNIYVFTVSSINNMCKIFSAYILYMH